MKPDITVLGLVIIIFWGLWGFLYKYGIDRLGLLPAILVTNVVYTVGNIVIVGYLVRKGVAFPVEGTSAIIGIGTLLGLSAALLFMYALNHYPGSTVIPLTAVYPAVSAVLAIAILHEEVKAVNMVGIVLAVIAGFLLTL